MSFQVKEAHRDEATKRERERETTISETSTKTYTGNKSKHTFIVCC